VHPPTDNGNRATLGSPLSVLARHARTAKVESLPGRAVPRAAGDREEPGAARASSGCSSGGLTTSSSPLANPYVPSNVASVGRRVTAADVASHSPVAWVASPNMDLRQWLDHGQRIGHMRSASNWWIGDWVRFGTAHYGERYELASATSGYDKQTLMNMAYVASRYPPARRRARISWSHHAQLAAMAPADQDVWLDRLEAEPMSVQSLREAMRHSLGPSPSATEADPPSAHSLPSSCPYCGHRLP
jgi:hypothetical protein